MPPVKVAIVQFEPVLGDVPRNMAHVSAMLAKLSAADSIDILQLCEMPFTGYCFKDRAEIAPFAERPDNGPTFAWCQAQARRLRCLVACGYVERGDGDALYNAMMVLSPDGDLVYNARKTFLYETDKTWASPSPSRFGSWYCPWLQRQLSFGICMDINPDDFKAPWEAYEFATSIVEAKSSIVLFSSAWNDHSPHETSNSAMPTIQYWANRLVPVIKAARAATTDCYFVCSNRTGIERGTPFVGGSCVLSLREPSLLISAGRFDEAVLVATLP
ncbi:hypothetical protein SPRG_13539 [Saprolegnia parasitica CBS 223.65]|uniref:CN hydrolase domain-containing protein n=1 Tax=Saprolegnia parasitica (strain CBS 223.65) TaxID=695850 RepID=A0A067C1W7_SAPPC|nr:hypothetical protein SPRG_13539 [Saprolegnia parasitica CBS 223.65]KDO20787.1 hypothetical protein SPRG_13539 [Saprolegnia parasitica CBS 223.65]|eukprot:XP_012208525.1 hypothetical protein SPRG_13539 [Saprolegnia parasitica CBS 223.65]